MDCKIGINQMKKNSVLLLSMAGICSVYFIAQSGQWRTISARTPKKIVIHTKDDKYVFLTIDQANQSLTLQEKIKNITAGKPQNVELAEITRDQLDLIIPFLKKMTQKAIEGKVASLTVQQLNLLLSAIQHLQVPQLAYLLNLIKIHTNDEDFIFLKKEQAEQSGTLKELIEEMQQPGQLLETDVALSDNQLELLIPFLKNLADNTLEQSKAYIKNSVAPLDDSQLKQLLAASNYLNVQPVLQIVFDECIHRLKMEKNAEPFLQEAGRILLKQEELKKSNSQETIPDFNPFGFTPDQLKIVIRSLTQGIFALATTIDKSIGGHTAGIYALAWQDNTLASAAADQTIKIWDISNFNNPTLSQSITTVRGSNANLVSALALQSSKLIAGLFNAQIQLWNINIINPQPRSIDITKGGHHKKITVLKLQGSTLFSGSFDNTIKIWNINIDKPLIATIDETKGGHTDWVTSLAIQDSTLISGSTDQTIKIWDISNPGNPQLITTIDTNKISKAQGAAIGKIYALAVQNNILVASDSYQTIKIWDISDHNNPLLITVIDSAKGGDFEPVDTLALQDSILVSGSRDAMIKIWDLSTITSDKKVKLMATIAETTGGHMNNVVAVLLKDSLLISASSDSTIKLWHQIIPETLAQALLLRYRILQQKPLVIEKLSKELEAVFNSLPIHDTKSRNYTTK